MKIYAFNDMVGKGWDSAAQFSFCIQESLKGNPQFWWVREVLRKFPHPPAWEHVDRNPDGTYKSFPSGKKGILMQKQLIRFANILIGKGYKDEARQVLKLAQWQDEPDDSDAADWWKGEEYSEEPHGGLDEFVEELVPSVPIDPSKFRFQVGDKVSHKEKPGSIGIITDLVWSEEIDKEIEPGDPWYIIKWKVFPSSKPFIGSESEASLEKVEEKKLPQKPKKDLRKEEEDLMKGVRKDLLKMQIWDPIEQYKQYLSKGEYDKARELFKTLSPETQQLAVEEAQKIFAAMKTFKKLAHTLIQSNHKFEARQIINLLRSGNE